jgi:hypothetical protein
MMLSILTVFYTATSRDAAFYTTTMMLSILTVFYTTTSRFVTWLGAFSQERQKL